MKIAERSKCVDDYAHELYCVALILTSPALTSLIPSVAVSRRNAPSLSTPRVIPCQTSSPFATCTGLPLAYDERLVRQQRSSPRHQLRAAMSTNAITLALTPPKASHAQARGRMLLPPVATPAMSAG